MGSGRVWVRVRVFKIGILPMLYREISFFFYDIVNETCICLIIQFMLFHYLVINDFNDFFSFSKMLNLYTFTHFWFGSGFSSFVRVGFGLGLDILLRVWVGFGFGSRRTLAIA